jgi:hypothetical protein
MIFDTGEASSMKKSISEPTKASRKPVRASPLTSSFTIMNGYTTHSVTAPRARSSRKFVARLVQARGKMASSRGPRADGTIEA